MASTRRTKVLLLTLLVLALMVLAVPAIATEAEDEALKGPYADLEYRLIGPAAGGRVSRVAGVPGDPGTYWAATASGGVWKSVNGGLKWKPVFDKQAISSIGSIAVAPSDPNVVWVGSGEANIRGNVGEGNGIYRSTDAGETWEHVWQAEGQIGTIIVHPKNPDVAFAAVLGSPFGPGEERGVLRTTDGGKSWDKVLYVDEETGASDVCFDPSNPRILFAGTWQVRRTPWNLTSGGPGGGLWVSRDGGDEWKRLEGDGLPEGPWGKVGVQVASSDPRRVYALIEAEEGGLFRSDDRGKAWKRISASRGVQQRAWYYSTMTIDPRNEDVVWFPQVSLLKTIDGGNSIHAVKGGGWDYHDLWIDPRQPDRIVVASDAGVSLSRDGGATWVRPAIPISQLYHVSVDTRVPYRVLGSVQDLGTVAGPSSSWLNEGILLSEWHSVGGGEAGHIVADPTDPEIIWAGEYLGYISRWNGRTRQSSHVGIYPENGSGHGAGDLRYRFQWTSPIEISPHDPAVVYHAGNVLFRTEDGGQSWSAISPDLTRDDETKQRWSGGPITGDNTGVEFYGTIFAVAESPVEPGLIWAGSDDGLVHVTRDGGANWNAVTPRDLPDWTTVTVVEASRWDAATAYVVADAHRLDDETPYLWKTTDYGQSWNRLGQDLDPEVYLHVVREDTTRRGMLYLGTERGVLVSRDDGKSWESLRLNMPTVAIADLTVAGDDLVVGTLGRSIWILDDLAAVREISDEIKSQPAHLFSPVAAIRRHRVSKWNAPLGSRDGAGTNPPFGATFTYWLAEKPDEPITVEILDAEETVVRKLSSELEPAYTDPEHTDWDPAEKRKPALKVKPGLNRASWDLVYEKARWVEGSRIDSGGPGPGPRALPGDYTLKLTVGGESYTRPLRVAPDPNSTASAEQSRAQFQFGRELRDRMSAVADAVTLLRGIREQVADRVERLAAWSDSAELVKLGNRIVAELGAIEEELHNPRAEVNYDVLAGRDGGAKLYSRLGWLAHGAWEHVGPPTQGMREVADLLEADLAEQRGALDRVVQIDLQEFNARAATIELPFVIIPED